jgi:hypothetical protein
VGWDADEPFWAYYFEKARDQGCDRIFQLGDFGFWEHFETGTTYVDLVGGLAEKYGITVYCLDGNHDKTSLVVEQYQERDADGFLIVRPQVRYAPRGHRWEWEGRKFMALGGAYSVDKGWRLDQEAKRAWSLDRQNHYRELANEDIVPFEADGILWFPEEEIAQQELDAILGASDEPLDVLLTHDKPRQSNPGWNRKDMPECYPNQDRISAVVRKFTPHLLAHGHLHYRYTDVVRCGDDGYHTQVEGISCDPAAGGHIPGYRLEDSWLVLDVQSKGLSTDHS